MVSSWKLGTSLNVRGSGHSRIALILSGSTETPCDDTMNPKKLILLVKKNTLLRISVQLFLEKDATDQSEMFSM